MNPPDWQNCSEEELWRFVAWHLEGVGVSSVLVGGAVVSIYTEGLYQSGDLDMVPDDMHRSLLPQALREIGFLPDKSRYYKHPECPHLFLEFPKGPVELGEEYPVTPDEILVEGRVLKILSPTDCVKDRLASYIHWKSRPCLDQAVMVCKRQLDRIDMAAISKWCEGEGSPAAFIDLQRNLESTP